MHIFSILVCHPHQDPKIETAQSISDILAVVGKAFQVKGIGNDFVLYSAAELICEHNAIVFGNVICGPFVIAKFNPKTSLHGSLTETEFATFCVEIIRHRVSFKFSPNIN